MVERYVRGNACKFNGRLNIASKTGKPNTATGIIDLPPSVGLNVAKSSSGCDTRWGLPVRAAKLRSGPKGKHGARGT